MKGLGGLGDIVKLAKQASELRKKMETIHEEMASSTVTATSGGGMVTVTVNGSLQVVSLSIEREVVNPDEVEMLKDLILAAIAEGQRRAQEMVREKFSDVAGGMDLKGLVGQ
jgi:DNA-binding YbaB/EbfC family protein